MDKAGRNGNCSPNPAYLVCLTATITPSSLAHVKRSDPDQRRADYLEAFRFWLSTDDQRLTRILFIENSGAELDRFRQLAAESAKKVEFISVPPSTIPPNMHYGYGELQAIDQALGQSYLRAETTHLIKATGRLIFPDLRRLLNKLPADIRVAVDARARLPFRPSERGFISTQLMIASHEFYDEFFRKGYLELAPAHHYPHFIEHLFFETLTKMAEEPGVYLRFPVNCEPKGINGATGQDYRALSRSLISAARAATRVVAPKFWL